MPNTSDLAVRYTTGRRRRGEIAGRTADQYLGRLLDFAACAPADPRRITRKHIESWLAKPGPRTEQPSPHYQRARLAAVHGFMKWLVANDHIIKDPSLGIDLGRMPRLIPRSLNGDEAHRVMAAADEPRTRLMALLMLQCGLRRSEVAAIRIEDLDLRKRTLLIRGKGGRGEATRTTYLVDEVWGVLRSYLPTIPGSSGPLFRSKRDPHRGLHPATVYELVVGAMKEAGVKRSAWDRKVPHALRHTFAHDLVDRGVDIKVVQEALGHARLSTTDVYTVGSVKNLAEPLEGRRYLEESDD